MVSIRRPDVRSIGLARPLQGKFVFRGNFMNPAAVAPSSRVDQLLARLQVARGRSEELFKIVRPAALYDRPVPERHRIIFYLGHLEAFDWNLLREPLGLSSFDPDFDKLFAFGIDPVEGGLPTDQPKDWPVGRPDSGLQQTPPRALGRRDSHCRRKGPDARPPRTWPLARSRHRTSPDARRNALLHAAPVARRPQIQPAMRLRHPRRRRAACTAWKSPPGQPRWDWLAAKTGRLAGTMSSRSIASKSPHLQSTPTT